MYFLSNFNTFNKHYRLKKKIECFCFKCHTNKTFSKEKAGIFISTAEGCVGRFFRQCTVLLTFLMLCETLMP